MVVFVSIFFVHSIHVMEDDGSSDETLKAVPHALENSDENLVESDDMNKLPESLTVDAPLHKDKAGTILINGMDENDDDDENENERKMELKMRLKMSEPAKSAPPVEHEVNVPKNNDRKRHSLGSVKKRGKKSDKEQIKTKGNGTKSKRNSKKLNKKRTSLQLPVDPEGGDSPSALL